LLNSLLMKQQGTNKVVAETKGWILLIQKLACQCTQSDLQFHQTMMLITYLLTATLMQTSCSLLRHLRQKFSSFPTKLLHAFLASPIQATFPSQEVRCLCISMMATRMYEGFSELQFWIKMHNAKR
jgi:hypothetical protein